jgi:hypothetical protein
VSVEEAAHFVPENIQENLTVHRYILLSRLLFHFGGIGTKAER